MLHPSLPSQVSESRTKERPSTQSVPPPNCHTEYLVPRKIHVSRIIHVSDVTLVIELS
jgi:hypothetical protein